MKKINALYVIRKENDKDKCLTIVKNKKEAFEFTTNYLRLEKANHFEAWCKAHNMNPSSDDSFKVYLSSCIDPQEANSFRMKRVSFNLSDIIEALRILCGFAPLGLSYEGPAEMGMLVTNLMNCDNKDTLERYRTQSRFNPVIKEIFESLKKAGKNVK